MDAKQNNKRYLTVVIGHALIGLLVFLIPTLAKIYSISILVYGFYLINKSKNLNDEALWMAAYLTGAEVFLRMTEGIILEQLAKFGIIAFLCFGLFFRRTGKTAIPYHLFLIFLLPGIFLGIHTLGYQTDIRKAIMFNSIGPITLAFSAIYCFQRPIGYDAMLKIIHFLSLPLICTVTYLFLYTPNVKEVVVNTQSNFATSGGFGPNQMSTILGLGIFVFFAKLLLIDKTMKNSLIDFFLLVIVTFRGIVTFSRGGVIAGGIMIALLLLKLYFSTNSQARKMIVRGAGVSMLIFMGIWSYSSSQTSGLIDLRYANKDAKGRIKESKLTGREKLIESEIDMFLENPILGIGVGKNKEYREQSTGIEAASHNEITRMLAEHGMLGVINLLILIFTPLLLSLNNRSNFFLLPFLVFWLLTINHAAMRIAAPAFIYALTLLKVIIPKTDETNTISRQPVSD